MKLTRGQKWFVYSVSLGVWLTGALWIYYKYFMRVQGEFGIEQSPLEPIWRELHGIFGYGAALVTGLLWTNHIVRGWQMNWRRWSGGTIFGLGAFLIITGCALYYLTGETARQWTGIAHWAVGLAALAAFLIHWLSRSLPSKKR